MFPFEVSYTEPLYILQCKKVRSSRGTWDASEDEAFPQMKASAEENVFELLLLNSTWEVNYAATSL